MIAYMEKINYRRLLEETVAGFGGEKRSLLLHACCAPCSSYCLEYLTQYFDVTLFYFNPNIMPREEYSLRLEQFEKLRVFDFELIAADYLPGEYLAAVGGLEGEREGGARCTRCFELRLEKTALLARGRYDYFGTTLTISPHKNAELINGIGARIGREYGVSWLFSDFKKKDGYKRSIELCAELGIYRQSYCGCRF